MLSGCTVWRVEKPMHEYWYPYFKPWVHYIPLKVRADIYNRTRHKKKSSGPLILSALFSLSYRINVLHFFSSDYYYY
jgi:hypothetical protein